MKRLMKRKIQYKMKESMWAEAHVMAVIFGNPLKITNGLKKISIINEIKEVVEIKEIDKVRICNERSIFVEVKKSMIGLWDKKSILRSKRNWIIIEINKEMNVITTPRLSSMREISWMETIDRRNY